MFESLRVSKQFLFFQWHEFLNLTKKFVLERAAVHRVSE